MMLVNTAEPFIHECDDAGRNVVLWIQKLWSWEF